MAAVQLRLDENMQPEAAMTRDEARAATDFVRDRLNEARPTILALHDRRGWAALGYETWGAYVAAEFGASKSAAYRELAAAQIERAIQGDATGGDSTLSQNGKTSQTPASQLQPLAQLNDDEGKRAAWALAQEKAGQPEKVTGRLVEEAVEEVKNGRRIAGPTVTDRTQFIPQERLTFGGVTPLVAYLENPPKPTFNRTNDNIEWASWSWNPVTGCLHDCPYCYARDIANRFYTEQRFVPTFYLERLGAPRFMTVPDAAAENIGEKNVFVCSMADLFGKWVPRDWIDKVLDEVVNAPQWNFLFLTKFPQRLVEFDWPANAWVGTTVDRQYRVPIAEKAFRGLKAGIKWLSCEPMLEPLEFTSLEMFDWIVVGGSSKSTQTEEFQPEREWVTRLHYAAMQSGCKWYEKPNLRPERVREYPGA